MGAMDTTLPPSRPDRPVPVDAPGAAPGERIYLSDIEAEIDELAGRDPAEAVESASRIAEQLAAALDEEGR